MTTCRIEPIPTYDELGQALSVADTTIATMRQQLAEVTQERDALLAMRDTDMPREAVGQGIMTYVASLKQQLAQAQARIAELERELEQHVWEYSPAMAEAKINQLNEQLAALTHAYTEAHAHLEAQRTATYQAVEREHAAKRELATLKEKQP